MSRACPCVVEPSNHDRPLRSYSAPAALDQQQAAQLAQTQRILTVGYQASSIAHDINSLLTVIGGSAELAAEILAPGHPAQADLRAIQSAVERGSRFTRLLLDAVRQQQPTVYPLHPGELIEDMLGLIEILVGAWIDLEVHIAAGVGLIAIDRSQADQILLNLARNARDAMPNGGTLTIAAHNLCINQHPDLAPGAYVCVAVTNTSGAPRAEPDADIGLAVCRSIAERHHGALATRSNPGGGSTLSLILPRHTL